MQLIIGIGVILYLLYVAAQIIFVLLGDGDPSWQSISGHLIATGILIAAMLLGHFYGDKEEEEKEESESQKEAEELQNPSNTYNPHLDKLEFTVYQQKFKTWWYDSDGDKHERSTIYANLRFYEDGTVIGIRSKKFPHLGTEISFTMKGQWSLEENKLSFNLAKTSDVDDSITTYISPEENREMKYYGEIADDDSLIKAGTYQGVIHGSDIQVGNFNFTKLASSTLILTLDEEVCDKLETKIKNHPLVLTTFQDTGNYYTNGETGPEWFTLHIRTSEDLTKEIEELVQYELSTMGESAGNMFWG